MKTPRTDEFLIGPYIANDALWAEFARQLERELVNSQDQVARLIDALNKSKAYKNVMKHDNRVLRRELAALRADVAKCHEVLGEDAGSDTSELWKFFQGHKELIARLEKAEAQRDRLAEALKLTANVCAGHSPTKRDLEFALEKARQALAELKGNTK